jgi:hypothetical protein
MTSPHNFKVQRLNGAIYDMGEMGIIVNSFNIESPSPIHYREKIEGIDGDIDLGTEYGPRKINARLTMVADDFPLLQKEVFRIFDSRESFYLLPDEMPGKRILVKSDSPFMISRSGSIGEFELNFTSTKSYFESIENTLNMVIAQISGNTIQKYKHATSTFEILNDGDETIDPRRYPLLIEFKGASTNLQIKNLTTGDTWTYTGTTTASDSIKLDGIRSTKNALSIFRDTNRKLITLAPGWNEFQIVGASGAFEISFDFRFYTL